MSNDRFNPYLAVFLIFRENDKILLLKRANTGHQDGNYSMVSGHVDAGESFIDAAIREALEESGVNIKSSDLALAYTLHSDKINRIYIDLFFNVNNWSGEITNKEPQKCDDLTWFEIDGLPENTVDYVRFVIDEIQKGRNFGSWGFESSKN
jgi:ADP-ribose pyrophosphatase YjhB (NUDIX family)